MVKRNRVVITGMGVLAPNGIGLDAFWQSLLAGRSGIGAITLFDASNLKSQIAGEVKNFDPHQFIEPELRPRRMARHTQFAYAAAMMALNDAKIDIRHGSLPSPTPVVIGVSTSALDVIEKVFRDSETKGLQGVSPTALGASKPQAAANVIADRIGVCANAATVSSACPSGLDAIAIACGLIRNGEAEIGIAGGADAPITEHGVASFVASGLSSAFRNGDPQKASRPFDRQRISGVLSEGAGIVVLENLERAQARGAKIYVELGGFGTQRDLTPDQPATGLIGAMRQALANANCRPSDIDYISVYGPGDPLLDLAEIECVKQVFGPYSYIVPISSIKGVTGNPLAAGGPLQLVSCALSIQAQLVVPTANCEDPDPRCDVNLVTLRPRKARINRALINVRGLGGSASSFIISRFI
ncbi:MAG: beta-ketoacyl-[acyl-carrier-protein] synthase II [Verrucomicrobia bacterium]|nr:MAG: beta-ketoacyl-[acyl-carrier-protein] synthase II [Verrucomicrobiota bacterium]